MMRSIPAYLLAVLTASVIIALEIFAVVWAGHLLGNARQPPGPFWQGLLGSLTLLPIVVFLAAAVIAAVPFALFHPIYGSLHGGVARSVALLFGVLVALFGFELLFGAMAKTALVDHVAFVGMSLAPGLLSGWVFHQTMVKSGALTGDVVR